VIDLYNPWARLAIQAYRDGGSGLNRFQGFQAFQEFQEFQRHRSALVPELLVLSENDALGTFGTLGTSRNRFDPFSLGS
jgi:hypothetical protein